MPREDLGQVQDGALVDRAQAGDTEAFGELYRRYLPPIYRFLGHRVSSRPDAEDLAGQVFYRAWRALPRYRERKAGFRAWLYRIARNAVIDHYRTAKGHASLDAQPESPETAVPGPDASAIGDAEALRTAMARLPEEQQTVLTLRFAEGLGHAEVAQILGKSEGACRMIQLRGLQALARGMGGGR